MPLTPEERARVEPDDLPFAGLAEPEIPTIDPIGQTTYLTENGVPS